jgi:hypothetical protein
MNDKDTQNNQIQVSEIHVIQALSKQISDMSMKIAVLEAYIQQLSEEGKQ